MVGCRDRLTGFDQSLMRLGDRELALLGVLICGVKVQTSLEVKCMVVRRRREREESQKKAGKHKLARMTK